MTAGVYRLRPAWLGFFLLVVPVRVRLELSDDSVSVHNGYTERRLARASIVGRRIRQHQHSRVLELVTDAPGARPLKVPMMLRTDSAFDAWLSGIRDLDAEEQESVLTELAATHDPRAIAAARRISRALTACVVLCAVWVVFFPRPYHAAVAVRGKSTSYSVVLDPWGPRDSRESVGVPRRVYEQVREGQEVRVILREGSLKMPWFYVVP